MADIHSFRPLTFDPSILRDVIAPPYDVVDATQRSALALRSPDNIVHVDIPEGTDEARYERAARLFDQWKTTGVLKRRPNPELIVYSQTFRSPADGKSFTRRGFFALVRLCPYAERVVLPHERTLSGPKEDRYKLMCATKSALSPVFLLYRDPSGDARNALQKAPTVAKFSTDDGTQHELAHLTDKNAIERVRTALVEQPLLIADGHHRYETALRYQQEHPSGKTSERPADFALVYLVDMEDEGLLVLPTHRLVHGLTHLNRSHLEQTLSAWFTSVPLTGGVVGWRNELQEAGKQNPSFVAVFPDGSPFLWTLRRDIDLATTPLSAHPEIMRRLDVVVLHSLILEHALGISLEAQAAYRNLFYVKDTDEAVQRVQSGDGNVLFLMNATPVGDIEQVCREGHVMPQKSTYFYPKVPTGIAIHTLE